MVVLLLRRKGKMGRVLVLEFVEWNSSRNELV